MHVDLHSHYLPPEACATPGVPVSLTALPDGSRRWQSGGQALDLEAELFDLDAQRAARVRQGLDQRILCLPPFTLLYELPAEQGRAWTRAVNDGIAAAARAYPDEFVGFAALPLQDVPAALAELERATGTLGLRGVEIATHIHDRELDDPALEPFWARVAAQRLPVLVHPHAPAGAARMGDYYLRNLLGNPIETALAGARLLFGGVLERHPDVVVILSHGGGALPHLIGRLTHGYAVRAEPHARASAPLDSLRRLYYDTVVFDARILRHLVELVGASQVVLGTDYPFDMGEETPLAFVRDSGLPAADMETILNNGQRLLDAIVS